MRGYRRLFEAESTLQEGEFLIAKDIASNGIKRYYVFESTEEFLSEDKKHRKHWYEVIPGNRKQRLYYDIDIDGTIYTQEESEQFILSLERHLEDSLLDEDMDDDTNIFPRINIYTSHSPGKYSFHLVVENRYAIDHVDCREQVLWSIETFDHRMKGLIDPNLYKKSQLFRLIGSTKIDKDNEKKYWKGSDRFEDSLICHYI